MTIYLLIRRSVVLGLMFCSANLLAQGRQFVRHVQFLSSNYHGHYAPSIDKRDIIWIDSTIRITTPLRSNGGEIILFGNEIEIAAPIDSRVYVEHDMGGLQFPHSDIGDIDTYLYKGQRKAQPFLNLYRDYYLRSPDLPDKSGETLFPELPSGETRLSTNGQAIQVMHGSAAPDSEIDFPEVKSGNIYIFAHSVTISSELTKAPRRTERFECSISPTAYKIAGIVSSGIRGGRGGLGSLPICFVDITIGSEIYQHLWPYSCRHQRPELFKAQGGINAPGGRGGDAGDISIHLVNTSPAEFARQRRALLRAADARGGQPGNSEQLQTPSLLGDARATDSRCSLRNVGSFDPAPQAGRSGLVGIDSLDSGSAITGLASILRSKDAQVDYDYSELAERSKHDVSIHSLVPSDSLSDYLDRSLEESELLVLKDFAAVAHGTHPPGGGYNLPILSQASIRSLRSGSLTERERALMREVSLFDDHSSNRLYSYLFNFGGLFNSHSANPESDYNFSALRLDLNETNKKLSEIKSQLILVNASLFRQLSYEQQRDIETDIENIKAKLEKAKAAAQSGGLGDLVAAITDVAASFGNIGNTLSALFSGGSKDPTTDLRKLGSEFKSGWDSSNKLKLLLHDSNGTDVSKLNRELESAMEDYGAFLDRVSKVEQRYLAEENSELFYALERRQTAFSRLSTRSVLFHDLLRAAITTYLTDPSGNAGFLLNNLEAIETLLLDFPKQEPRFMLRRTPLICEGDQPKEAVSCIQLAPSKKVRVVSGTFALEKGRIKVPLYRIAPSGVKRTLPAFGIKATVNELNGSSP